MAKKDGSIGLVVLAVVVIVIGIIIYFFAIPEAKGKVPDYVTGETRLIYEWALTKEGAALLEQVPCYCGCKFEGHKHSRHCFWRDDGSFDKHGITCSVCLDIGKKAKRMLEQGKNVCEIRKEIDAFYKPNAHLGTETPMPAGCA